VDRHYEEVGSKEEACKVMSLPMSTYYYDPKKSRAQQEEEDAEIRGKIEQIRVELKRAGYRPLLRHLQRNGVKIGETKLRRIMKKFELHMGLRG
jgi:hypothetical protein